MKFLHLLKKSLELRWKNLGDCGRSKTRLNIERLETRRPLAGDITIFAAGETGQEKMDLLIDGVVVRSWSSVGGNTGTRQFVAFNHNAGASISPNRVRVAFTNDASAVPDRNLLVDKIVIDQETYQTESSNVYSTGTWRPEDGIQPGYRQSEWLNTNGYFQYAENNGSIIEIFAAGWTGLENLVVQIDGVPAYAWNAIGGNAQSGQFNRFSFRAATTVTASQIRVEFNNDDAPPPADNNLRVDRIIVDEMEYQTEAPSTFSTGTYLPENGIVLPGFWQSEWLHSNGYFAYDSRTFYPGNIGLADSVIATREDAETVEVAVVRNSGSDGTVTIDYKVNSLSARNGTDFRSGNGTLTFGPGVVRQIVSIPLVNDSTVESPETFSFVIENPQGGANLLAPRTATITITDDDLVLPNYANFASKSGMRLNGNASYAVDTLQLTPNVANRRGTAFYATPIPILADTSFQSAFQFRTTGGVGGGEGLTFMVQYDPRGSAVIGRAGGELAYGNIARSLAIEFDTQQGAGEVSGNHVSVWRNGNMVNTLGTQSVNFDFNRGRMNYVWIDYSGDQDVLTVYVSQGSSKPRTPLISATVDLRATVGARGYFGFSAATSNLTNAHRIAGWTLNLERPESSQTAGPTTIVNEPLLSGLTLPTAVAIDSTGQLMYIAQKQGQVVVARDGLQLTEPFLDFSRRVNNVADRGLLDIELHPDFPTTPYVYLAYTYDPPEVFLYPNDSFAGPDQRGNRAARVTRVTADASTNFTTAIAGSEIVLVGKNSKWENFNAFIDSTVDIAAPPAGLNPDGSYVKDFLASDSNSHTIGSLEFAPDGSLLVSVGDGASYNTVDPRTARVQSVDSLSGKILRINAVNGQGLADNPFSDGDLTSNRSKVYQLGLRNPFRMALDPTGRIFVGDVGWTQWEEINSAGAGANFGWPYFEGGNRTSIRTPGYEDLSSAIEFYAGNPPVVSSIYALNHAADGINAIVMGAYYTGITYPVEYRNNLFFNDLGQGIVRAARINAAGEVASVETFATGANYVVHISQAPDGNLVYVDLDDGIVGRWKFV